LCLSFAAVSSSFAETDRENALKDFSLWIDWKLTQSLNDAQRAVLLYLQNVMPINRNLETLWLKGGTGIDSSKKKIKTIAVPKTCQKFQNTLEATMNLTKNYSSVNAVSKSLEDGQMKKIKFDILDSDGKLMAAFYELLKSVGLFEKYESELRALKNLN
jgi:hypothetical protein